MRSQLTTNQLKRLRRVLVEGIGKPELIIKLLHEVDHPEIIAALNDELLTKAGDDLWYYEHAIKIGKGNLSKLEDKLIGGYIKKFMNNAVHNSASYNYNYSMFLKIAKIKNMNVVKVQDAVISCKFVNLQEKIQMLESVTKVKGANIQKTLSWYKNIHCRTKSNSTRKLIDESIDKIERSYKFRAKDKPKTEYASDEQIQELLDLIDVRVVQEV